MEAQKKGWIFVLGLMLGSTALAQVPDAQDSIPASNKEEKNRNVMLNASDASKPREVNIGLPGTVGGTEIFEDGIRIVTVHGGEAVFIRKDHNVRITKQPYMGEQFKGITMVFNREFLRNLYQEERKNNTRFPTVKESFDHSMIKLPKRPQLESLFLSITPYFSASEQLSTKLADLKVHEGVIALLDMDPRFYPVLFDFADPWKIDLMDFMNSNYTSDLTIEEFANYTGRSLATFKRDFKKVSNLSPQKWLIEKRLEKAYEILSTENQRVEDVCYDVGFKNRSHFATLFKKQYGVSPASLQTHTA